MLSIDCLRELRPHNALCTLVYGKVCAFSVADQQRKEAQGTRFEKSHSYSMSCSYSDLKIPIAMYNTA